MDLPGKQNRNRDKQGEKKTVKTVKIISVLCLSVWMMCAGLPASASGQPTREQAESINLIVSRMVPKVTDECVQFNPKHQRVM